MAKIGEFGLSTNCGKPPERPLILSVLKLKNKTGNKVL